jgi:hypothetical protein
LTLKGPDQICVVPVGEWLEIGTDFTTLALLHDDPSVVASLSDNRITFAKPGRYQVKALAGFTTVVVTVLAHDAGLIDLIHVENVPGMSAAALKRRVLRELGRYEAGFDGTQDTFFNFNPKNYGASSPPPAGVFPA